MTRPRRLVEEPAPRAGTHLVLPAFLLDGDGRGACALTLTGGLPVTSVFVQAVCIDQAGGNGLYTSSNGLEVRVR